MAVYTTIRKELETFSPDLAIKQEVIILTKTDLCEPKEIEKKKKLFKKKDIFTVSILDDVSIKELKDNLIKILRKG